MIDDSRVDKKVNSVDISILVPAYNCDISLLAEELTKEVQEQNLLKRVEIIIMDDCSQEQFRVKNRQSLRQMPLVRYFELDHNVGRAEIRNELARKAVGRYLLFLDADSLIDHRDFIKKYLEFVENQYEVVYGGRSYKRTVRQDKKYDFYIYLDSKASKRNKKDVAWKGPVAANVMIRNDVFSSIPFDKRFAGYGYEDTEWAIRLAKKYKIHHINNSCSHVGVIDKSEAFGKMRDSIKNYLLLWKLHPREFRKTAVHGFIRIFRLFGNSCLERLDSVLSRLFFKVDNVRVCHFIFQLDKAVLLAISINNNLSNSKV